MIKCLILNISVTLICNILCTCIILNFNDKNTKKTIDTITQRTCEPWDDCK